MLIAREAFADIYPDAAPLLQRHWQEIAHYKDIPLNVRVAQYEAAEKIGVLRCFGARLDGELIGYAVFIVDYPMHYADSLQARQDVLFIAPEHRNLGFGSALIEFCDRALAGERVQVVHQHSKSDPAIDIGPVLMRCGYQAVETLYSRRLDLNAFHLPSAALAEAQAAYVARGLMGT